MASKTKSGLVTDYLEHVSGLMFEEPYRAEVARLIRGHAGVYALYKRDKLYYVGLATNLMSRQGRLPVAKDQKRALNRAMTEADSNRRASFLGGNDVRNRMKRKTNKTTGTNVLDGLVSRRMQLRGERGGVRYTATLRRDGQISYAGQLFASPSMAGRAALGRNVNGWVFWMYRDGKKGWVLLNTLR